MAIRAPCIRITRRRANLARQAIAALAVLVLAGSCAAPVVPLPAPPPRPRPQPAAPAPSPARTPRVGWQDMPIAPGEWRWSLEGGQSTARFGLPGQTIAMLSCRGRTVSLTRYGNPVSAQHTPTPTVVIRTTSTSRPEPGVAQAGAVSLAFAAGDPLLDAIAFSRGRFALEVQEMAPLALPSWPEVARVIDDCRG